MHTDTDAGAGIDKGGDFGSNMKEKEYYWAKAYSIVTSKRGLVTLAILVLIVTIWNVASESTSLDFF